MAEFSKVVKEIWGSSVKFVSRTAKSAAKATKYKVDELTNISKHRDLIRELGEKVYILAKEGLTLPEEAAQIVRQIAVLDTELTALRANHAAQKAAEAEQRAAEKAERAAQKAAVKAAEAIEKSNAPVEIDLQENPAPVLEDDVPIAFAPDAPTMDIASCNASAAEDEAETNNDIPTMNV